MALDPKALEVGKRYVVSVTGAIGRIVAECIGHDDLLKWGILKPCGRALRGFKLKREDYIPHEEYDEAKHGALETWG
jgi:hypothetical protein